eukprot:jgi/Psemu1/46814/gm1.46814_g
MNAPVTTSSQEPSACEVQCRKQQDALTECMTAIRDAREEVVVLTTTTTASNSNSDSNSNPNQDSGGASNDIGNVDTACLAPSVAAWTDCCSRANNGEVESNEGHIGIQ